jgi:hypothetical protein
MSDVAQHAPENERVPDFGSVSDSPPDLYSISLVNLLAVAPQARMGSPVRGY